MSRGVSLSGISSAKPFTKNQQYLVNAKPLTPEQLERKMVQARTQDAYATRVDKARKTRLQNTMSAQSAELECLLKVDIGYHIENWRKAWQAGSVEKYFEFHSENFRPSNGVNREKWEDSGRQRVEPSKKISLELSEFEVQFVDNYTRGTVTFDQSYVAGSLPRNQPRTTGLAKAAARVENCI